MTHRFLFVWACIAAVGSLWAAPKRHAAGRHRLIIWSIDGLAAGYFDKEEFRDSAVWQRLLRQARVFNPVETTVPAVTYPAHTAMITGVDPAKNHIYSNHPIDPWGASKDGWTWYLEDVATSTLWDAAAKRGKTVANMQWPVTMVSGSKIRYHIPQFDRAKGPEEQKLMRVLSTPGLHREIETHTGVSLTEHSGDDERNKAARYIWHKKSPDLMLLYNPGLDSIEHANGPYSAAAYKHLELLGGEIEKFLNQMRRESKRDRIRLLIVSDHGFLTYKGKCNPNAILKSMGYIDPKNKKWSYMFETAGGVARLVGKGGAAPFAGKAFGERLAEACPGIDLITEDDEEFESLKRRYSGDSAAFLVSRDNTLMSAGFQKEEYQAGATGHTHGFLPERPDMHTVAILFGADRGKAAKIGNVKDVYGLACSWLKLPCENLKSAQRPKKAPARAR